MFVDECSIEDDPFPAGKRVRVREGEELFEKNLKPSFKSGRTTVSVLHVLQKGAALSLW